MDGKEKEIADRTYKAWVRALDEIEEKDKEIERLRKEKEWIRVGERMPEYNMDVVVILKHCSTQKRIMATLKRVDKDDCTWRTVDGDSEISFDWDVTYWISLQQALKEKTK